MSKTNLNEPGNVLTMWRTNVNEDAYCFATAWQQNGRTQLLFATGIEGGIHDRQVLKHQPSVTSRLMFQYLMIIYGIK